MYSYFVVFIMYTVISGFINFFLEIMLIIIYYIILLCFVFVSCPFNLLIIEVLDMFLIYLCQNDGRHWL